MCVLLFFFGKVPDPSKLPSEDMQPIELRLDTLSCFQLAIFGLDLLRSLV